MKWSFGLLCALVVAVASGITAGMAEDVNPYVGDNAKNCGMCHKQQVEAWKAWKMAKSWDSLSADEQKKEECIKCHVTGYGEPGGWESLEKTPKLTGVQCEACHGPGGNHLKAPLADKAKKKATVVLPTEAQCLKCHVAEGNPNFKEFVFKDAKELLSAHFKDGGKTEAAAAPEAGKCMECHAAPTATISLMSAEAGEDKPAAEEKPAADVNPYVGDNVKTCAMCHKKQVEAWKEWKMAKSWDSLSADEQKKDECLKCHVTGYGKPGGWVSAEKTPKLVGIQCEACHGPAGAHMKAPMADIEKKKATIVAKPDEAVCLECHVAEGNPNYKEFVFKDAVAALATHLKAK